MAATNTLKLTLLPSALHHHCLLGVHEGRDCLEQVGIYICIDNEKKKERKYNDSI